MSYRYIDANELIGKDGVTTDIGDIVNSMSCIYADIKPENQFIGTNEYLRGYEDCRISMESRIEDLRKEITELRLKTINRPPRLYAIEDVISGNISFNARGGCYRDLEDVKEKIDKLRESTNRDYRVVVYELKGSL